VLQDQENSILTNATAVWGTKKKKWFGTNFVDSKIVIFQDIEDGWKNLILIILMLLLRVQPEQWSTLQFMPNKELAY
jgi:hypothetical protein